MPAQWLLWLAALMLVVLGLAHSYLGERLILGRLLKLADLPRLGGDIGFMRRVIRFAWHLTSVAWWGFAALLIVMAYRENGNARGAGIVLAVTFLVSGATILIVGRGRHPAWPLFLIAAVATFLATW